MASGDGLLVRVRPRLARLTIDQALGLCALAQELGSGLIDLTSRANLQLRGVLPRDHGAVIDTLCGLGLLDADARCEALPAVLVAPCWQAGDDTEHIASALAARLDELPGLPPKFGFAVDAGPAPVLTSASADVRIERGLSGGLIVRADGAPAGCPVTRAGAVDAAIGMAAWFATSTGAVDAAPRRMKAHLVLHPLPEALKPLEPLASPAALPAPGMSALGPVYGVAFGQIEAGALAGLLRDSGAVALRLAPQRLLILECGIWRYPRGPRTLGDGHSSFHASFITTANDTRLLIDACPGAPGCASATVATRAVALTLAASLGRASAPRSLHVSGCAKGCARARAADLTLVGRNGAFDLVRMGCAWDAPALTGLCPEALPSLIGTA
jgi:precorrin-3B synthase